MAVKFQMREFNRSKSDLPAFLQHIQNTRDRFVLDHVISIDNLMRFDYCEMCGFGDGAYIVGMVEVHRAAPGAHLVLAVAVIELIDRKREIAAVS